MTWDDYVPDDNTLFYKASVAALRIAKKRKQAQDEAVLTYLKEHRNVYAALPAPGPNQPLEEEHSGEAS